MASYQTRQRDPLLDQNVQAMLERRGRELFGLALILAAFAAMLMLWTYTPEDPGWMVATDGAVQNAMGRFGASTASTLIIICGKGAWSIPVILFAWGTRFVLHRGSERAMGRMIFAVIAVALGSVFAATHVPGLTWTHSFGLGGLFGDTIVGALLGILPLGAGAGLKLLSILSGAAFIAMGLYVTGFEKSELRSIARFLVIGLITTYARLIDAVGYGAAQTGRAAQALRERREAARLAGPSLVTDAPERVSLSAPPPMAGQSRARIAGANAGLRADVRYTQPEPVVEMPAAPIGFSAPARLAAVAVRPRGGLLGLMKRSPIAELLQPAHPAEPEDPMVDDRVRARISDAIRSRVRPGLMAGTSTAAARITSARQEPPLVARQTPPPATLPGAPSLADASVDPDWDELDDLDDGLQELSVDEPEGVARFEAVLTQEPRRVVQQPVKKSTTPSRQAVSEAQPRLRFDDAAPVYEVPPLSLLTAPPTVRTQHLSNEALEENARMLESVLDDYGVKGEIVSVRPGPVVTMYELEPAPGLKASRVIGLADDIARSMSALSARVSTVPGRTVIGIELPNAVREKVVLREILSARDFGDTGMRLPLALGKDIGGDPVVANLAKMPHLLIAGTTGSGKSVAINTMILSLLYKLTPEECRLIMIDPKMLELSVYDGIPHLLSPVVTDPKKAVVALKWVVGEMEERYRKMSRMGVRNIEGYNGRVREALAKGEMFKRTIQTGFDEETGDPVFETDEFQPVAIPYIVVIVDEMADLMMVAGKEIEACIQRLAQMARASGIHLIMATQRPSVDVITGTIKANFPTRISFQVTSKIDSRTILGEQGAEQLLGMGDMLYMAGGAKITRIHGPFVSDEEVEEIVNHLKSFGPPVYMSGVVEGVEDDKADDIDLVLGLGGGEGGDDALYDQAVAIVAKDRKCSTSYIQRKLGIGYNKAARLVEQMEEQGVVTPANHVGKREILLPEH
ncbi:MAG: DNA translocase FtsK [Cereibacter sphaeroides]|uniref:DNA translocase FtsK n=1 Tax=Cereibacter sphaeroides TaxID=1063 RepID=A0A2W5S5U1_CERSP|nr:MAG: DNA translocase FtsK [Cereibacter sphaeroides]